MGTPGVEGGENLEAGDAGLDRFADLTQGDGRNGSGKDVVKSVVGERMAAEHVPPDLDLAHNRVGRRHGPGSQRQGAGKVHVRGDSPEGCCTTCGLGWLREKRQCRHRPSSPGPER